MVHVHVCVICDGSYATTREHCPFCGARRIFLASHSYAPSGRVSIEFRDCARLDLPLVRAYRHTVCSDEDAILNSPLELD